MKNFSSMIKYEFNYIQYITLKFRLNQIISLIVIAFKAWNSCLTTFKVFVYALHCFLWEESISYFFSYDVIDSFNMRAWLEGLKIFYSKRTF